MVYRFKGNNQHGYRNGRLYRLKITKHTRGDWPNGLTIRKTGIKGLLVRRYIVYKTQELFYKQWEQI